jgi:hypothetical protein
MNIQAEKLQVIQQILQVYDETIIKKVKKLLQAKATPAKTGISALRGKLKPQTNEEIDKQLKSLREEWERDI